MSFHGGGSSSYNNRSTGISQSTQDLVRQLAGSSGANQRQLRALNQSLQHGVALPGSRGGAALQLPAKKAIQVQEKYDGRIDVGRAPARPVDHSFARRGTRAQPSRESYRPEQAPRGGNLGVSSADRKAALQNTNAAVGSGVSAAQLDSIRAKAKATVQSRMQAEAEAERGQGDEELFDEALAELDSLEADMAKFKRLNMLNRQQEQRFKAAISRKAAQMKQLDAKIRGGGR